jgi:hypothetical protein
MQIFKTSMGQWIGWHVRVFKSQQITEDLIKTFEVDQIGVDLPNRATRNDTDGTPTPQ